MKPHHLHQPPLGGLLSAGHGPDAAHTAQDAASGPSLSRENEQTIPDNLDDMFLGIVKGMHRDALDQRQEEKTRWIATARLLFQPGERRACTVCGRHHAIAQAHHVVPLASQFDRGFKEADHTHVWLCPNHHVVIHQLLTGTDLARDDVIALLEGSTQNERRLIQQLLEESALGTRHDG